MPSPTVRPQLPRMIGIGIDVGMTYTGAAVCAIFEGGTPQLLTVPAVGERRALRVPSKVFLAENRRTYVGSEAEARSRTESGVMYNLFKRRLRTGYSAGLPSLNGEAPLSPVQLTQLLIEMVLNNVGEFLSKRDWSQEAARRYGEPAPELRYAFTHPGMWKPHELVHFQQAIENAGIDPSSYVLIPEPVAAVVAAVNSASGRADLTGASLVLVCDLGGGTLDFALVYPSGLSTDQRGRLHTASAVSTKSATHGDEQLGMSNLDKALGLLAFSQMQRIVDSEKSGTPLITPRIRETIRQAIVRGRALDEAWEEAKLPDSARKITMAQWRGFMLDQAEEIKKDICRSWESEAVSWALDFPANAVIKREQASSLLSNMDEEVLEALRLYLEEVRSQGYSPNSITHILVCGGGSYLPSIQRAASSSLAEFTERLADLGIMARIVAQVTDEELRAGGLAEIRENTFLVQRGAARLAIEPDLWRERRSPATYGVAVDVRYKPGNPRYGELIQIQDPNRGTLTYQRVMRRFIQRNTTLPLDPITHVFTPTAPGQRSAQIEVYGGDSDDLSLNSLLGTILITIPESAPPTPSIIVSFAVADDGKLHVSAVYTGEDDVRVMGDAEVMIDWSKPLDAATKHRATSPAKRGLTERHRAV